MYYVYVGPAGECAGDGAEVGGSEGASLETADEEVESVLATPRPDPGTGIAAELSLLLRSFILIHTYT